MHVLPQNQEEVLVLSAAAAQAACDECIDLGANIVRERRAKAADAKLPLNPTEAALAQLAAEESATTPQGDDGSRYSSPYKERALMTLSSPQVRLRIRTSSRELSTTIT
jgi:hypothetical protein